MNNLHRELAPISAAAWADIEEEAKRTFAATWPAAASSTWRARAAPAVAAVGTGHLADVAAPADGVDRAPARVAADGRAAGAVHAEPARPIDDVERGAQDADWQPVKDAAKQIALRRGPGDLRAATPRPASPACGASSTNPR